MNDTQSTECYVSVDVETAGPNPGQYSLLTIGACLVDQPRRTFYVELKPVNNKITSSATATHHLDLKRLSERGAPPADAMKNFAQWLET